MLYEVITPYGAISQPGTWRVEAIEQGAELDQGHAAGNARCERQRDRGAECERNNFV